MDKVCPKQAVKAQNEVEAYLYSFFNSTLDGGGWLTPYRGSFTPRKNTRYQFYRRLRRPPGRFGRVLKISPPPRFFCSLLVLYPYLFLCPDCRSLCFLALLYNTHNTNTHAIGGIRTCIPSGRSPLAPRLRPLGHWDRWDSISGLSIP